ncbi:unnamed protein product [Caenorhabditis auriculariae]|uniref:Uncharacterized protein n=1 Tax=Caenorhabditis auriculariae TaxID=2777116 RepID=A0A8S1GN19_9PELO|nr:unnamed protein product [Caenorhabditis auriculariae]
MNRKLDETVKRKLSLSSSEKSDEWLCSSTHRPQKDEMINSSARRRKKRNRRSIDFPSTPRNQLKRELPKSEELEKWPTKKFSESIDFEKLHSFKIKTVSQEEMNIDIEDPESPPKWKKTGDILEAQASETNTPTISLLKRNSTQSSSASTRKTPTGFERFRQRRSLVDFTNQKKEKSDISRQNEDADSDVSDIFDDLQPSTSQSTFYTPQPAKKKSLMWGSDLRMFSTPPLQKTVLSNKRRSIESLFSTFEGISPKNDTPKRRRSFKNISSITCTREDLEQSVLLIEDISPTKKWVDELKPVLPVVRKGFSSPPGLTSASDHNFQASEKQGAFSQPVNTPLLDDIKLNFTPSKGSDDGIFPFQENSIEINDASPIRQTCAHEFLIEEAATCAILDDTAKFEEDQRIRLMNRVSASSSATSLTSWTRRVSPEPEKIKSSESEDPEDLADDEICGSRIARNELVGMARELNSLMCSLKWERDEARSDFRLGRNKRPIIELQPTGETVSAWGVNLLALKTGQLVLHRQEIQQKEPAAPRSHASSQSSASSTVNNNTVRGSLQALGPLPPPLLILPQLPPVIFDPVIIG